ncbi:MAG: hypothetical protein A2821_04185 [Candidatus Magasanikbacteria bacterium RIFCSPHIGHO2_01_FULL_41_23]|uniref:Type II toxin-antitoxin system HicA family toxin n=1 Tax=Candidatus Magasanikbacteria bacterium RIFCSPLOWO2_01_FULL_40_15 TaxID=1798686 RepID=A0A1F6N463_9BACT|nr:MAG: hypothetical protein A2821_04185 [Candidatus Magasanikbacteria bacterium RIFCSPHIGHO2_01_FULL_41_23]OGH67128.1 MAG: hypothetical protein A3C66_02500 [Candidatus Magasanikbacteria bacterium RIFCSPHIGHO2_02_FULL_41_35]OGH76716.1 MAG: hypothetical protein A3F22_03360 [Candidatus Magasanikbacteria bacterium RIFCSPHIGHO2_12_FULL_41_16]OGH78664.1 MAG: hypothetical protein A2983_04135 [Candidatus Magasanikbacteria bacterium RIFCSPLOWO2_01_FULL_40_15]
MGEFTDVKRRKLLKLLNWLSQKPHMTIKAGGKHQIIVKYNFWDRPFPIPFKHNTVNKYIVKAFMDKLVVSNICTEEEFRDHVG